MPIMHCPQCEHDGHLEYEENTITFTCNTCNYQARQDETTTQQPTTEAILVGAQ